MPGDKKISQLPDATIPLSGAELIPLDQLGTTCKVMAADLGGIVPPNIAFTNADNTFTVRQHIAVGDDTGSIALNVTGTSGSSNGFTVFSDGKVHINASPSGTDELFGVYFTGVNKFYWNTSGVFLTSYAVQITNVLFISDEGGGDVRLSARGGVVIRPGYTGAHGGLRRLQIESQDTADTQLALRSFAGQTADQCWSLDSSNAVQARLTANGWWTTPGAKFLSSPDSNSTSIMQPIADLTVQLDDGISYIGRLVLFLVNNSPSDGCAIDFDGGTATMSVFNAGFAAASPDPTSTYGVWNSGGLSTDLTITNTAASVTAYVVEFFLDVDVGGTLIPRYASILALGGTISLFSGCNIWIQRVTN